MSFPILSAYMITAAGAGLVWIFLAGAGRRNGFPQPHPYIAAGFLSGMLFTLPAFAAETAVMEIFRPSARTSGMLAGPVEEACKFAAAWFAAFKFAPKEGMRARAAAAIAASMGFAAVENAAYLAEFGISAFPARITVTPMLHLAWALIWGRALDGEGPLARRPGAALLLAAGLHSAYNLAVDLTVMAAMPAVLLAGLVIWGMSHRVPEPAQEAGCVYCLGNAASITGICPACSRLAGEWRCQGCGEILNFQSEICQGCGMRQYHERSDTL